MSLFRCNATEELPKFVEIKCHITCFCPGKAEYEVFQTNIDDENVKVLTEQKKGVGKEIIR